MNDKHFPDLCVKKTTKILQQKTELTTLNCTNTTSTIMFMHSYPIHSLLLHPRSTLLRLCDDASCLAPRSLYLHLALLASFRHTVALECLKRKLF